MVGSGDPGADGVGAEADDGAEASGLGANGMRSMPATQEAERDLGGAAAEGVASGLAANGMRSMPATQEAEGGGAEADDGAEASGLGANGMRSMPATQEAERDLGGATAEGVASGLAANGMRSMRGTQEEEGVSGALGEDGGLDYDESSVTNEAKIDEAVIGLQAIVNQEVVAESSGALGLDNNESAVTNEPNFDRDAVGVQETVNQEVMADSGSDLGLDNGGTEANFDQFSAGLVEKVARGGFHCESEDCSAGQGGGVGRDPSREGRNQSGSSGGSGRR